MLRVPSYYLRKGCFPAIYTKHRARAVSTSKLGLSSLVACSSFMILQMEDTPRFKTLLCGMYGTQGKLFLFPSFQLHGPKKLL